MITSEEIWKEIKGYEGHYLVSNKGNVKSIKRNSLIMEGGNLKGYRIISLWKNGIGRMYRVHRLVAESFIPNPDGKPCVDHINGNRSDNRVENLRWVTPKENQNNPITKEKFRKRKCKAHHTKEVEQLKNGNVINVFVSIHQASRHICGNASNICAVCKGKYKTYKGYKWRYKKVKDENKKES